MLDTPARLHYDKGTPQQFPDMECHEYTLTDWSPLHVAVWQHNLEDTTRLANDHSVNSPDSLGWTPVHIACIAKNCAIWTLYRKSWLEDIGAEGRSPHGSSFGAMRWQLPGRPWYNPNDDSERATAMGILEILLSHHPRLVSTGPWTATPLHCAASSGWLSHVCALVEAGSSIETDSGSPIYYADTASYSCNPVGSKAVRQYLESKLVEQGWTWPTSLSTSEVPQRMVLMPSDPTNYGFGRINDSTTLSGSTKVDGRTQLCDVCTAINFDEACGERGYLHHASLANLRWASKSCRLCTILWATLGQEYNSKNEGQIIIRLWNGNERHGGVCSDPAIIRVMGVRVSSGCSCQLASKRVVQFDFSRCQGRCLEGLREHKFDVFSIKRTTVDVRIRSIRLAAQDDSIFRDFSYTIQSGLDLTFEPLSPQCLSLIQGWLLQCRDVHANCQINPRALSYNMKNRLPSRLLELGAEDRLRITLSARQPPNTKYLALSHRWVKGAMPTWVTSIHNVESRYDWFSSNELPKSIADAIRLAWRVGFQYIWIDSICIIQDSYLGEDWRHEAAKMGDVYANAEFTISADSAVDDNYGFLGPRLQVSPSTEILLRDRDGRAVDVRLREYGREGFVSKQFSLFDTNVQNSYLADRAWVFQERLLSPRTLHLGKDQMFWQCDQGIYCEDGHKVADQGLRECAEKVNMVSRVRYPWLHNETPDLSHADSLKAWTKMVRHYSTLRLTKPEDKLFAIAGLAKRLHKHVPYDQYFAGIFSSSALEQITWSITNQKPEKDHQIYTCEGLSEAWPTSRSDDTFVHDSQLFERPSVRRAPSFSWACVDGEVVFHDLGKITAKFCGIMSVPGLDSEKATQLDNDTHVAVQLQGRCSRAYTIGPFTQDVSGPFCPRKAGYIPLYDVEMTPQAFLWPDSKSDLHHPTVYCCEIGRRKLTGQTLFLALLPLSRTVDDIPIYRRIGLGRTFGEGTFLTNATDEIIAVF